MGDQDRVLPSGGAVEDTLSSDAGPDQQLVVYTAEPGSPSHQALRILASWAATAREPSRTSPS